MKRKASAIWRGTLKEGKGNVSTDSGALKDTAYSFTTRFEEGVTGTNPEELIAAAHAGCFSMALSGKLVAAGMTPESIATEATVMMEKLDAGWTLVGIHLEVKCNVPSADKEKFKTATEDAKSGCPISRLLAPGTKISMNATLA